MARKPNNDGTFVRPERTRATLSHALVTLMVERPYGVITVEDVLQRSGISRSTFYTHFGGKDDLLGTHFSKLFEHISRSVMRVVDGSLRVVPLESMLLHLSEKRYRKFYRALVRTGKMTSLRADAIDILTDALEDALRLNARGKSPRVPIALVARFISSAFVDLVEWWVEQNGPCLPSEMQTAFDSLVAPAIALAAGE